MHEVAARGLLKIGILKPDSDSTKGDGEEEEVVKRIVESGVTTAFYPHGVGALFLPVFLDLETSGGRIG